MAKRSEVRKRTPKGLTDKQKKMLRAVIGGAIPPVGAVMLIQNLIKKRDDRPGKGPGSGPKKKRKLGPDIRARKSAMSTAQKQAGGKGISAGKAAIREAGRGKVGPKRNVLKDKKGKVVRDKKGKAIKTGRETAAFKKRMEERKRSGGK
tara:strand:+ start:132 stop:578 length:447 start_codon:yes stop_codon:yes gene_type:complete